MFLPLHGTFFLSLGVCADNGFIGRGGVAGRESSCEDSIDLVAVAAGAKLCREVSIDDSKEEKSPLIGETRSIPCASMVTCDALLVSACRSVSLLDRALWWRWAEGVDSGRRS